MGGTRVSKCHPRVEAYGTVDELNAHVGLLAEMIRQTDAEQYDILKKVQRNLFIVQTLLATEADAKFELPQLPDDVVQDMEHQIDTVQEVHRHVARTVCRRAERRVVQLAETEKVDAKLLCYVNRLSDYLFVLSRHLVVSRGDEESLYE